jgi:hypothetical protein
MKRKRGRPSGPKYPHPHTTSEGTDIAVYGKIGGTEAMAIVRHCPYSKVDWIKRKKRRERDRFDREYLKRAPEFAEQWAIKIGPLLGKRIVEGDAKFFHELAEAVEKYSQDPYPIENFRRYLAMQHRFESYIRGIPFTSKSLREYYRLQNPRDIIDSSTLSRMFRWARSAKL